MIGRASALAALGLKPGADPAAIDDAYRRLIKQYHPDRQGGDGTRAAEIIHAYRALRGGKALIDPLQFNEQLAIEGGRSGWPFLVSGLALAAAAAAAAAGVLPGLPTPRSLSDQVPIAIARHPAPAATQSINDDLHLGAIGAGVGDAVRLFRTSGDEMALASASRECLRHFRAAPNTTLLDRCAAFDDAVVGLLDRDPLRDTGPFAMLDVTGRQWAAASMLSPDSLAIDGRLRRIRLKVELALAPAEPPPPPQVAQSVDPQSDAVAVDDPQLNAAQLNDAQPD